MTDRKRLPKHWCSTRDNVLSMQQDLVNYQYKILGQANSPAVARMAGMSLHIAHETIKLLKELEFEEGKRKAPAVTEAQDQTREVGSTL